MKLAPLLLAAPVVFTMVAADPRPTPGPDRRVLDRWRFARQDDTSSTAGGGIGVSVLPTSAAATTSTRETTSAAASTPSTTETPTTSSTPQQQPTSTTPSTSQAQQQPTTTSTPPVVRPTSSSTSSTVQSQPTNNNNNNNNTPAPSASTTAPAQTSQTPTTTEFSLSTPPPSTAVVSTTDQSGRFITSYVVVTQTPHSVALAPTSTASSAPKSTGVSQSTVIGLAVTGSIAGLLIILLIVWKLTGKRFSDLEDNDDDAIKWPELHKDSAAMTPIPARPSTRAAGAETDTLGADFDTQSAAHSAADLSYQPYSDDPGHGGRPAYYDPYSSAPGAAKTYPSPPGSHDGDHKTWGVPGEAQYYDVPRGQSPGPNAIPRGMSPGPGVVYDNRIASPAPPNMAYADPVGRMGSPGPGGYGYGAGYAPADPYSGRNSPGPNMAYAHPEVDPYGRQSPGPGMAYNGSVGRVASPGPNPAYR